MLWIVHHFYLFFHTTFTRTPWMSIGSIVGRICRNICAKNWLEHDFFARQVHNITTARVITMQRSKHTSVLMFYTHFLSCFFCWDIKHLELLSCSWSVCKKQGSQCTCNIVVCLRNCCCYGNGTVCSLCIVTHTVLCCQQYNKYWNFCHFAMEAHTHVFCVVALHMSVPAIRSTLSLHVKCMVYFVKF